MLSLILFLVILGTIVLIHEFGHFIFSKMFGVYVYEYSIGMGKKIWSKKPKGSETEYSIRMIPIGGFVKLAGEDGEDGDKSVPKERKLYNKNFWQRFLIFFMGPGFNMLLALVTLFVSCAIFGASVATTTLASVNPEYPAYKAGARDGDILLAINDEKVSTWTQTRIKIATVESGSTLKLKLKDKNGDIKNVSVTPVKIAGDDGEDAYIYGVGAMTKKYRGFIGSIKYSFVETRGIVLSMLDTVKYLFTGRLGVKDLSGPVGIYEVVDSQAKYGIANLLYLLAYLSINVGIINLIPFPAFDGGHILFLLIEKIRRKPVSPNVEATITGIGFIILMLLMVYVTFHDVFNLIK